MKQNNILELIEETRSKEYYVNIASRFEKNGCKIDDLIDLMLNSEHPINFRAAYLLDILHSKSPELFESHYSVFVSCLNTVNSDSVKRHVLKILAESKNFVPQDLGSLFDICLNFIVNSKEKVATKVHAMQVNANLCTQVPELANELVKIIEDQINRNSVAFSARAKHIIKQLKVNL